MQGNARIKQRFTLWLMIVVCLSITRQIVGNLDVALEQLSQSFKDLQDKLEPSAAVTRPSLKVIDEWTLSNGKKIVIGIGSLEKIEQVDAIVNAANANLQFGGGIAGAIAKALGSKGVSEVYAYIKKNIHTPVSVGSASLTPVPVGTPLRKLGFKYIIHSVAPDYRVPAQKAQFKVLMADVYKNTLNATRDTDIKSMVIPSLGVGIFSCPLEDATEIEARVLVRELCSTNPPPVQEVILVIWKEQQNAEGFARYVAQLVRGAIAEYCPESL